MGMGLVRPPFLFFQSLSSLCLLHRNGVHHYFLRPESASNTLPLVLKSIALHSTTMYYRLCTYPVPYSRVSYSEHEASHRRPYPSHRIHIDVDESTGSHIRAWCLSWISMTAFF
ncbi:hypothetical protein BDN70DRAFT_586529 [Pholiota conissans]|uniref:Uncharacterized protein n=1 Tax=Pholiota conissans TaxID=109636 RepID=A0A9P6CM23_9AGAR|nr:hypothetical protein BDN70DRAFT_586529 [Pholiota conissans]